MGVEEGVGVGGGGRSINLLPPTFFPWSLDKVGSRMLDAMHVIMIML